MGLNTNSEIALNQPENSLRGGGKGDVRIELVSLRNNYRADGYGWDM